MRRLGGYKVNWLHNRFIERLFVFIKILTSKRPNTMPAPIVPIPAIMNGIDTCNEISHHFSYLIPGKTTTSLSSSSPKKSLLSAAFEFLLLSSCVLVLSKSAGEIESSEPDAPADGETDNTSVFSVRGNKGEKHKKRWQ
jgi:hypothetical protein